jgi:NADH dehydrogenase [ubiquinone] 1 alpha subcomplex assembly factor 5
MTGGDDRMTVFDRRMVRRHKERAARDWPRNAFLVEEVADRLADRLLDMNRSFPLALDLGAHGGETARRIRGVKGVERVVSMDLAAGMVARADGPAIVGDEEALPFGDSVFDLVVSTLSLHWVNDLPGALIQARMALKPDGLFLAAMLGGETLFELRRALMEAEMECLGGLSPRLSPFAEVRDAGGLLQRAGFALPVVDTETITVSYRDPLALMRELRAMGETNAVLARDRRTPPRGLFPRAAKRYIDLFAEPDGRVPATFQILWLAGWAPAETQQQPSRRGSGQTRLADALGTVERSAGEKAGSPLPPRDGRA